MSRSLHTDPYEIRAARRLAAPFETRAAAAARRGRSPKLRAQQRGHASTGGAAGAASPRVVRHPPGAGRLHPAERREVARLLRVLPARYIYGVRRIELCPLPEAAPRGDLALGRLLPPGCIIIFAQRPSPWLLEGLLSEQEQLRLACAGAAVAIDRVSQLTEVCWPGDTLRRFMLHDVLLHELAHHALQSRRCRRSARGLRTWDHEALAAQAARVFRLRGRDHGAGAW